LNRSATAPAESFRKTADQAGDEPPAAVSPLKDFQKVPNSVVRIALADRFFKGKSKFVWDYLWSVSRGAIKPSRVVRKSRKEIKAGSGIGSMVTVDAALAHLEEVGLIVKRAAVGSLNGNEYEVFTPEEALARKMAESGARELVAETSPSSPSTSSTSSSSSPTQKLDHLDVLLSSTSSTTQLLEKNDIYGLAKTFLKTSDDDDTHTMSGFVREMENAVKKILGANPPDTAEERARWQAVGKLLADELIAAAGKTDAVSSIPAFLNAHLRRKLTAREDRGTFESGRTRGGTEQERTAANWTDKGPRGAEENRAPAGRSRHPLEVCLDFANHLRATGQGITNPGGYATTIHRTGEADDLIDKFLAAQKAPPVDASQCPDCQGSGWWYPHGIENGVVKCRHERLRGGSETPETKGDA
jgi:hypothetical protein